MRIDDLTFDVPDIYPVRTMEPYKPCWCGSGVKWKWCHKDRHLQKEIPPGLFLNNMYQEAKKGICLHPDAPENCSAAIIRAHTVQKRGGLRAISENGHVLSVRERLRKTDDLGEAVPPPKVGVNDASTFMGFCSHHDSELFKPIEKTNVELSAKELFLLSFRAVCYEKLNKLLAVRWAVHQRELDKGRLFEAQAEIQSTIHYVLQGTLMAVEDAKVWKADYDQAFKSGDLSNFWYYAIVFDTVLPFVGCGAMMPEFDFNGKITQSLGLQTKDLDTVSINVTSFEGNTIAIFSWLGKTGGGADKLVQSFSSIAPALAADRILCFLFEHIENTFLNPSWWHSLPETYRNALLARTENGTIHGESSPSCLLSDGKEYVGTQIVKRVLSRLPE